MEENKSIVHHSRQRSVCRPLHHDGRVSSEWIEGRTVTGERIKSSYATAIMRRPRRGMGSGSMACPYLLYWLTMQWERPRETSVIDLIVSPRKWEQTTLSFKSRGYGWNARVREEVESTSARLVATPVSTCSGLNLANYPVIGAVIPLSSATEQGNQVACSDSDSNCSKGTLRTEQSYSTIQNFNLKALRVEAGLFRDRSAAMESPRSREVALSLSWWHQHCAHFATTCVSAGRPSRWWSLPEDENWSRTLVRE